ncbi:MAG: ABC transporter ATP-binding protein [Flavobacteriales bacterium]|jgi:lipopolysaccharide transport system ATP-binding protein|nr:ABC transporter ATP-binding protein [Flavobacteriales bacterium]
MSDLVLKIERLGKMYRLGQFGTGTLSHDLNSFIAKIRGKDDPAKLITHKNERDVKAIHDFVWVLKNLNLHVNKGDVLGIIGKNGAGKSTLLKLISQITSPTEGLIKYKGNIASLLEVGTGMHPEMTAKENIFLNGAILGMKKEEIKKKFDDIIDFSGCQMYVDTPVKRFSSGMRVRLGFAVAAFLEPDILIVDEVLAVGDYEFQKNAVGKIKEVSENEGRTVLFVSHNMGSIRNLCNRGVVLNQGEISFESNNIADVIEHYQKGNSIKEINFNKVSRSGLGNIQFNDFKILNVNNVETKQFCIGDNIRFYLGLENYTQSNQSVQIAIGFRSSDDRVCSMIGNEYLDYNISLKPGFNSVKCEVFEVPFSSGKFIINVILKKNQITEDWIKDLTYFEIQGGSFISEAYTYPNNYNGIYLKHKWDDK